jgi:hypothetical protein
MADMYNELEAFSQVLRLWPTYAFMKADEINFELVLIDEKVFVVTFDFV